MRAPSLPLWPAVLAALALSSAVCAEPVNLLALGEGALPVIEAPSYSGWPAVHLLDEPAGTGWASVSGEVAGPHLFVFELPVSAALERFEFDTASIDGDGRGALNVLVEVSTAAKDAEFTEVLRAKLADRADGQRFAAAKKVPARWVRLTLTGNHGDAEWSELMAFRGFGERPSAGPPIEISGTYDSDYSLFHVRQQGTALAGCYEYQEGVLDGTIEGRLMKLTWREGSSSGPAVMVFASDGRSFRGYWWHGSDNDRAPSGTWSGEKKSSAVGSCPHWSGSVGGELQKGLASAAGRARLYGILFDSDSASIRPESRPVLEEVVRVLGEQPDWKLVVEGHTDALASEVHNLQLSQARAASVVALLVSRGIGLSRLEAKGLGESQPVADNATELGRARNRRVELVRR